MMPYPRKEFKLASHLFLFLWPHMVLCYQIQYLWSQLETNPIANSLAMGMYLQMLVSLFSFAGIGQDINSLSVCVNLEGNYLLVEWQVRI